MKQQIIRTKKASYSDETYMDEYPYPNKKTLIEFGIYDAVLESLENKSINDEKYSDIDYLYV